MMMKLFSILHTAWDQNTYVLNISSDLRNKLLEYYLYTYLLMEVSEVSEMCYNTVVIVYSFLISFIDF